MSAEVRATFSFPAPPTRVWAALTDPVVVASCLPGGELLEVTGERSFRGAVGVTIGPFGARFEGEARFEELDETAGRAVLSVEAEETRGRAEGTMRMRSRVIPSDGGTTVEIHQALSLDGPLGQFVPPGLLAEVARHVLARFESRIHDVLAPRDAG